MPHTVQNVYEEIDMDNLDRFILGYLLQHPNALYGEIAQAVGCSKSALPQRISQLVTESFLSCDKTAKLTVTNTGRKEAVAPGDGGDATSREIEFSWDFLYIPTKLE